MPRRAKAKGLYQRGPYWLDWDRKRDGSLRSPNLAIFWYDAERGRIRSASAGTADDREGASALDRHYLMHTQGAAICPTCGQRRQCAGGAYYVTDAMADYLALVEDRASADAIRHRLAHVVSYVETLPSAAIACERVDGDWIERFRRWATERPIVSPSGKERRRSLATVENSVLQLSAAINHAHRRGATSKPAQFRAQQPKEVNRTPQFRADVPTLARMFAYVIEPGRKGRDSLQRFLIASIATLARPDAAHDISTTPSRGQWNAEARVLALNPRGRRQTRKYRATVPIAWQAALHLDGRDGFFVGVASVRSAWDSMAAELGLPIDGEAGMKLIRRSMAHELRKTVRGVPRDELEMMLGHRRLDSVTELYAPFDPAYLANAKAAIEAIIDEIEAAVPGAFHRTSTGAGATVIPLKGAKSA